MSEEETGDRCTDSEPQAKRLKLSAKDTDVSGTSKKPCIHLEEESDKELKDGVLEEGGDKELKDGACGSHGLACEDKIEIQSPTSSAAVYLREEDVGIIEYISSHPGFFAILKQRCSSDRLFPHPALFVCLFVCFFVFVFCFLSFPLL